MNCWRRFLLSQNATSNAVLIILQHTPGHGSLLLLWQGAQASTEFGGLTASRSRKTREYAQTDTAQASVGIGETPQKIELPTVHTLTVPANVEPITRSCLNVRVVMVTYPLFALTSSILSPAHTEDTIKRIVIASKNTANVASRIFPMR